MAEPSGFPSRPSPPPLARERWSGQAGFLAETALVAVGRYVVTGAIAAALVGAFFTQL